MRKATLIENINIIENLFDILNNHFFNNSLDRPILTLNPGSNNRNKGKSVILGWCSTKKIWLDKDTNKSYYEITICPEFIDRSLDEICSTLLHEMTHLYNINNGVKDVSRNGYYHNKYFKEEAERHGLIITKEDSIGWSHTRLNQQAKTFVQGLDIHLKKIVRSSFQNMTANPEDESEEQTKKKSIKYICPGCGISVLATKVVNIQCADCEKIMIDSNELEE